MSYVARGDHAACAGRYVELTGVRAENEALHRENRQLRTELMEMRRLAEESGRYQRLLGLRDATPAETHRGAGDRHRRLAVLPRRARRHRSRRGDGQARDAGADARGRGRPDQPRRGQELGRDAAGRSALGAGRVVPRTGGRGILRGKSGENGYRCSIEYLARGEPVEGRRRGRDQRRGRRVPAQPGGRARHAASSPAPSACTRRSRSRPTSTSRACPTCWSSSRRRPRPIRIPASPPHARRAG